MYNDYNNFYDNRRYAFGNVPRFAGRNPTPFPPMMRSVEQYKRFNCGELRSHHAGTLVELTGKLNKVLVDRFVQLKDQYGTTQVVIPATRSDLQRRFNKMPLQSFISIRGLVRLRPNAALNGAISTGTVEVLMDDMMMVKVNRQQTNTTPHVQMRDYSTLCHTPKISSEEYIKFHKKGLVNKLNLRKCVTTDLPSFIDQKVEVYGWVERCTNKFLYIRDGYGKIQCIATKDSNVTLESIKVTDIVRVEGEIKNRPQDQINVNSKTGYIELVLQSLTILESESVDDDVKMELDDCKSVEVVNSHTLRTHTCGELRPQHVGQHVIIIGWLQYKRLDKFLLIRDAYGLVQCVKAENFDCDRKVSDIPLESVVRISGIVADRTDNTINDRMSTGEVEVLIDGLEVLNESRDMPFVLKNYHRQKESLRLQYRYIDLRYPEMQNNLRMRSTMLHNMRCFLIDKKGFVEVETPTLFCRTPGGAREFVVPTHNKGLFYSLVQSPQQFKQMLMVGGVDRYFQIARCYRDEATRPDRQPEFTQLDVELSFTSLNDILTLIEELLHSTYPQELKQPPYARLTYNEALETYGSDKPNITYDLKLKNITQILKTSECDTEFGAYCLPLDKLSAKMKDFIKKLKGRYYPNVNIIENTTSSFDEEVDKQIRSLADCDHKSTVVCASGPWDEACQALGELRLQMAEELTTQNQLDIIEANLNKPLWIVDFPLFIKTKDEGLVTCHHPFTAPNPSDVHLLDEQPLKVRSLAYDLVINGIEIGGGSVRIHDYDLQLRILNILNIDAEPLEHMLNALKSGCPPHGGIALGIDRLIAMACGVESIRDVIAFPKNHEGKDPLSGAPNKLKPEELQYYHIDIEDNAEPPHKKLKVETEKNMQ